MQNVDAIYVLRTALAELYPTEEDSRPIVRFAKLNTKSIKFSAKAINNWYNILTEAEKQNRVSRIIEIALEDYPENAELVVASQVYNASTEQAAASNTVPPSETAGDAGKRSNRVAVQSIKILFLAANPLGTTPLLLDHEIRAIDTALQKGRFRDRFDVEQHWAVGYDDLQEFLLRHQPDIVHFSGHGSGQGEILLEGANDLSHPVAPDTLGNLFKILKDNVRCVVLNACYSEPQAQAIAQHIDVVVGMTNAISNSTAINFAAGFYLGLAFGRTIKTAFELGCSRIELASLDEQDRPKLMALHSEPDKIVLATPPIRLTHDLGR